MNILDLNIGRFTKVYSTIAFPRFITGSIFVFERKKGKGCWLNVYSFFAHIYYYFESLAKFKHHHMPINLLTSQ